MEKCLPKFLPMQNNPKWLVITSLLVIVFGFGLLWFNFGIGPGTASLPPTEYQATSSASEVYGEKAFVSKVIDGDTIELENGQRVRYIGIDTPETVDPRRPVGCFGKEASNRNKGLVEGKIVILQKDISDTDKYGRLLRYIYLPLEDKTTLFVNDYLIREGFAKSSTYPPDVKFTDRFKSAEEEARLNNRGLWGRCM